MAEGSSKVTLTLDASDAIHLFQTIKKKLNWEIQPTDVFMDIGCGTDRNCCNLLLSLYPEVKKVIAIDAVSYIIRDIEKRFPHPKIEYQIGDMEDRTSLEQWKDKISKVVSVNCFNCIQEQKKAFQNLYWMLQPGGEAAILFNAQSGYFEWFLEIAFETEWKDFYEGVSPFIPDSYYEGHDAQYFESLLKEVGFTVLYCQMDDRVYSYASDDNCRNGSVQACPFSHNIPAHLSEEFIEESFQIFLKHNGRDINGNPCLKYRSLTAIVIKPN